LDVSRFLAMREPIRMKKRVKKAAMAAAVSSAAGTQQKGRRKASLFAM